MEHRPDPDQLLAKVQEEELRSRRGRLKVFFGAAPGVGKTYAMLEAARVRKTEGTDVVVGWAETHGRQETQALLDGLEQLPPRLLSYRGRELREFDLDAALERRPTLILLDELAHTNAAGSRHTKRWQDAQELLAAGVDVYTTLNVQHVESLHDVVAQITGVRVAERVPDAVFEGAEEAELVDLPPDDLIRRMREGKVYVPEMAAQAMRNFFRPGNLIALRELALRQTAERVDRQMQLYRSEHAVKETWPAVERVAVCLGPSPYGQRLVRAAKQLAARLKAEWLAIYVETPEHARLPSGDREQIDRNLRLAEQLGGEAVTLSGESTAEELLAYARSRNVTKLVLGKPPRRSWTDPFRRSFVDQVIGLSGDIDVYILGGSAEERLARIRRLRRPSGTARSYLLGAAVVGVATLISALLRPYVEPVNLVMVYLVGVVLAAAWLGRGPSILASVLSVALFDFFFVPPYLTFAVGDSQYILTFVVMFAVALVISNLTARVKLQAERARDAQRRTQAMYDLTQAFARVRDPDAVAEAAVQHLSDLYGAQSAVFLPADPAGLRVAADVDASFARRASELGVARWAYEHQQAAGLDTDTLPGSDALYLPLEASGAVVGVLGVRPLVDPAKTASEQRHLLEAVAGQTALALERAMFAERARLAQVEAEAERLRSTLLSSVSHDFRTPLAAIVGASSALVTGVLDGSETKELAQSIYEESERLSRYVTNLLDITRLESGSLVPNREWQPLEEVVGSALGRLRERLEGRPLSISLPPTLPMVAIDGHLMEQVFFNLLENAARHTPAGTPIEIAATSAGHEVSVRVADRGPGLPEGEEIRVFEKFYRHRRGSEGTGLGLAICMAVLRAHGGQIRARNRDGGGAEFLFTLPVQAPPAPPASEAVEPMTDAQPGDGPTGEAR